MGIPDSVYRKAKRLVGGINVVLVPSGYASEQCQGIICDKAQMSEFIVLSPHLLGGQTSILACAKCKGVYPKKR